MTWRVNIKTTSGEHAWTITANTPNDFRVALNELGRANGVGYSDVLEVRFVRMFS